jgi:hypothetical protein
MIELMVAVSVLSVGVILIARSFLSSSGALSSCEGRIVALSFLESRMAGVEEKVLDGEKSFSAQSEPVLINGRNAKFDSRSQEIKIGEEKDKLYLNNVMMTVSWLEANKPYDEILGAYFETKKSE